jgi:CDP-glycerol glycerophosphotransferase
MTQARRPPPRISVVVPVFGVEAELGDCIESILGQSFTDIEVIAVDDHSPDGCGAILDGYARQDLRVRVIHLDRTAGPGNARNAGVDRASGQYVWFVDGDDVLPDGAMAAIAAQLDRTEPDVLLIGFERLQESGAAEPNAWRHLLRQARAGAVFTLADRPEVIRLSMTSWSKVISRKFYCGLGLRFGPGIHEDVPITCALLLAAERLATLDRVCYRYRERRGGALTNTPTNDHFQVFGRYESVFAGLDAGPAEAARLRPLLFDRAIWHYTSIFGAPGALPDSARREFFHRMSAQFAQFKPAGYSYPRGLHGIKYRLVERDAYHRYLLVQPLNQARLAVRQAVRTSLRRAPR